MKMKKNIELQLYKTQTGYEYVAVTDMSIYGDILIAPVITMEIEFNIYDDGMLRQKEIESLDKQITEIREESLRKIIKLGERRQELLAINHEQLS